VLTRKTCYPGYEIELTPYKINLRKPQSFFYFKKLMFNMKSNNKAKKKKGCQTTSTFQTCNSYH